MSACVSCSTALDPLWKFCVDCGTAVVAGGSITIPGAIRPLQPGAPRVRTISPSALVVIVLAALGSVAAFVVAAQWLA